MKVKKPVQHRVTKSLPFCGPAGISDFGLTAQSLGVSLEDAQKQKPDREKMRLSSRRVRLAANPLSAPDSFAQVTLWALPR
jgi:hypothetical protein